MSLKGRLVDACAPALDLGLALPAWASAHVMMLVRKMTPRRAPRSLRMLDRVGVYPVIDHYYDPSINPRHLRRPMSQPRALPGIDLRLAAAVVLLDDLVARENPADALRQPSGDLAYHPDNTMFGPLDAGVLYALVRRFRPRRIIEIGAGMSTLVAQAALRRNREDDPEATVQHICIEPYEQPWLERLDVTLLRERMERLDPAMVDALEVNDILFIDSSHVIRPQGDVVTEVLEWVGRVRPGVLVHFHDIFTPRDYPEELLTEHRFFWNEQYLVEAFLAFNNRFEVILPVNALLHAEPDRIARAFPDQTEGRAVPASLWLRAIA